MRRCFTSVMCIALFGWACDRSAVPTSSSQAPSSAPAAAGPTQAATYTVFGVVRTPGNVPVAGARVVVLDQDSPASVVTTDGNGSYNISPRSAQPWGMSPLISASKPGYFADIRFTNINYSPISKDTQLDFELDPLVFISVGEVVQGRIFDAVCSHWGYGTSPCQRFALAVPSSGTLELMVSAAAKNVGDIDVVKPVGSFGAYITSSSGSIPVTGGLTYEIRVTTPGRQAFELTTALR
jgi:hypothetical protein